MPSDFAPGSAPAVPTALFSGVALLDAEKLDCYRLAVDFQAWPPVSFRSAASPTCVTSSTGPASPLFSTSRKR